MYDVASAKQEPRRAAQTPGTATRGPAAGAASASSPTAPRCGGFTARPTITVRDQLDVRSHASAVHGDGVLLKPECAGCVLPAASSPCEEAGIGFYVRCTCEDVPLVHDAVFDTHAQLSMRRALNSAGQCDARASAAIAATNAVVAPTLCPLSARWPAAGMHWGSGVSCRGQQRHARRQLQTGHSSDGDN